MGENYELCFYWQLDKDINYKPEIYSRGICISNKFKITFDEDSKILGINPKPSCGVQLYNEGISSFTAIVGKNGAGKTTLLNKLRYDIAEGQIHNYVIVFYSKTENKFKVLDDNNLINKIEKSDSIHNITIQKINYDIDKLKQYFSNTTFVYYNNQLTSNMYWLRNSSNGVDISTEHIIRDAITETQQEFLNSYYVKGTEKYDIISIAKKKDRIKQLSVLSFLSTNHITEKINIKFPRSVKIFFYSLEFQISRRKSLMDSVGKTEKLIMSNSIDLFKNILSISNNDWIKHFLFDRYNTIIDKYIKTLNHEEYYKQAIDVIGENYINLNFKKEKIDIILNNIKSYIKRLPISQGKRSNSRLVDIIINTFCYIKILIEFSSNIEDTKNQKDVQNHFDFISRWARNYDYILTIGVLSIPGIKEMVDFLEEHKGKIYVQQNSNSKDLTVKIPISNFDNINSFVHKVCKSHYLFNNIFRIEYDINFSSGEDSFYNMFGRLYDIGKENLKTNVIILLDEPNNTFHPEWEQKFINTFTQLIPYLFKDKNIHIIMTTHSPIILSDIPKENIIFLNKEIQDMDNKKFISYIDEDVKIDNTFGANIYDLYKNAFFLQSHSIGTIGDLAYKHINKCNDKLEEMIKYKKENLADIRYCESIISLIGEPLIKSSLEDKLMKVKNEYCSDNLKNAISVYDKLSSNEKKSLIEHIIKGEQK